MYLYFHTKYNYLEFLNLILDIYYQKLYNKLGHQLNSNTEMATYFYDMKDKLLQERFVSHLKYLGLSVCFYQQGYT